MRKSRGSAELQITRKVGDPIFQALQESKYLLGETTIGATVPVVVGHVSLVRIVDEIDRSFERIARIREAKAALKAEARERAAARRAEQAKRKPQAPGKKPKPPSAVPPEKAQRNFTDPESRIMWTQGTFEQAYDGHAAVDATSQVIVARDVTNQQNDGPTLAPMLDPVRANCGEKPREVSADAGYCSEANLEEVRRRRIRAYNATCRQRHGTSTATDEERRGTGPLTRAMRARLRRGGFRSRYRLRKQTVEPVFGQLKECRGFRQFLLRGLDKARGEWNLACVAHNLLELLGARVAVA